MTSSTFPHMVMMTSAELMRQLGRKVEGVNLVEIVVYLQTSKVNA